jgi:tRNA G10  N-methylase Trm11
LDNPLNDLDGGVWTYFLRSVINTRYPVSGPEGFAHHIRKIHPTPKPPQLMRDIIKFFTKKNEWVLDYFMGVGGTLLGASLCDRNAIGIDLNKKYIEAYKKASKELGLKEQVCLCGDSLEILSSSKISEITRNDRISLICIDPPYGDMMSRKKTGEAAKKKLSTESTPFTDHSQDLGNVSKETFLTLLRKSVEGAINYLKDKRYVIVFTKDFQPSGKDLNLLHYDIIKELSGITGLNYVGMKIWADESINLYPYGYPYAFVPNQLHQYILVFRKEAQVDRKAAKAS